MMQARGIVVLTEPPTRRSTRSGAIFATARAVAPAIEDGTTALALNLAAFNDLAERLLEVPAGALVGIEGTLAATIWAGKDGGERRGLRVTLRALDTRAAASPGSPRLEAPRPRETAP